MVGAFKVLQFQIIGHTAGAVGGIKGLGLFVRAVIGGFAGQINLADIIIGESRNAQQCIFKFCI